MSTPRKFRRSLRAIAFVCVLASISACQYNPLVGLASGDVQAFNSLHGTSLSVDQANTACAQLDTEKGAGTCEQFIQFLNAIKLKAATKPGAVDKPYKYFSDCYQAVDYVFGGRADLAWARDTVHDESRGVPSARNGSYLGCGQLSPGLRAAQLKGPWNDAYYGVLAIRTIVDIPSKHSLGNKCHWQQPNYCG